MADNPLKKLYEAMEMYEVRDLEQKAEIERLKKENQELSEKLKKVDMGKGEPLSKKSENDLLMRMYEAQAIAIEKEMELDKLKKESEAEISKLKKEKDELIELLIRQERADQNLPVLAAINDLKQQLIVDKRLRNIQETHRNTILFVGGMKKKYTEFHDITILSSDRSKWIETKLHLPYNAWASGAIYFNGELFLFGGPEYTKALYKLDKNLKWIQMADMNEGRFGIAKSCLEWNGNIWVFGGETTNGRKLSSVERYDPRLDRWTIMPSMKECRSHAAVVLWNGSVFISGGCTDPSAITVAVDTVECYSLHDCETELPNMPHPLRAHSIVSYKNKLISMCGYNGEILCDNVWELDPNDTNAEWQRSLPMKHCSDSFGGVVLDGDVYAIGGWISEGVYLDRVEIFNEDGWQDGPSLPFCVSEVTAMVIPQSFADRLCNYEP